MPKLIIGLVGLQGCGKGTVADLLRQEYQGEYYRFSAILSDILTRLAIEKTRDHFNRLSESLRHTFGEDIFSYAIEKDAVFANKDVVIIDGIRRPQDIVALEPLPNFTLVSIEADAQLRYERMKKRGEKATESTMSWDQFLADEQDPTERMIPFVMERAKHRLTNSGTREELAEKTRTLIKELLAKV